MHPHAPRLDHLSPGGPAEHRPRILGAAQAVSASHSGGGAGPESVATEVAMQRELAGADHARRQLFDVHAHASGAGGVHGARHARFFMKGACTNTCPCMCLKFPARVCTPAASQLQDAYATEREALLRAQVREGARGLLLQRALQHIYLPAPKPLNTLSMLATPRLLRRPTEWCTWWAAQRCGPRREADGAR